MVGQIHLQGCDRGVALGRRVEVGSFSIVFGRPGISDPVHGVAARIGLGNDLLGRMAPPLRPWATALAAVAIAPGLVSFGLWQTTYLAMVAMACFAFGLLREKADDG